MINEKFANHPRIQTVGAAGEVKLPENEKSLRRTKREKDASEKTSHFINPAFIIMLRLPRMESDILYKALATRTRCLTMKNMPKIPNTRISSLLGPTFIPCNGIFWQALWPGIHGWYVGGDWEWYRPIYAGDEFKCVSIIREMVEKKGRKTGGGSTYFSYGEKLYVNQRNELVGKERLHTAMAERSAAGEAKKDARNSQTRLYPARME